ncbi:MAG: hypothetical protein LBH51_08650 [Treponema sp.]|jgi:hypothetical protein|nr:hypothetical protein [Treponema sp.]
MVNLSRRTILAAALAAAWLALAVVFAGIFIIEEHDHDCSGEDCHICLELQIARWMVEAFGRLGAAMAAGAFISRAGSWVKPQSFFYGRNPVELKIRFNC